jgi:hypothetical protein
MARGYTQSGNPADNILKVSKCTDFEVTGDGSNANWQKSAWTDLVQNQSVSPYRTKFKILYSDSGIYCLYSCEDSKITATLRGENMDLYNEDVVEAFFWADESIPVYFEYELSPLNYELILMVPNYGGKFLGWIPWHYNDKRLTRHEVSIQKDSKNEISIWYGEFFIPFELMKPMVQDPPKSGTKWRANFYRIDYDNRESYWSWQSTRINFHDYDRFGTLLFQ